MVIDRGTTASQWLLADADALLSCERIMPLGDVLDCTFLPNTF